MATDHDPRKGGAPDGDGTAAPADAARASGRRSGGVGRAVAKWSARILFIPVIVAVLLFLFAVRTDPGQEIVFDRVILPILQGLVDGGVQVEEVRSRDLRYGATLGGVRITGPDGSEVVVADSVRARYDWWTLLQGEYRFDEITLFSPVVTVVQPEPDAPIEIATVFAVGEETDTTAATSTARVVEIGELAIRNGQVDVRIPAGPDITPRARTIEVEGRSYQTIDVRELNAVVRPAELSGPRLEGPTFALETLSLVTLVYEEPGRVEDVTGTLSWIDGRITLDAERIRIGGEDGGTARGRVVVETGRPDGLFLALDFATDGLDLAGVRWIEPRLPEGRVEGGYAMTVAPEGVAWTLDDFRADLAGGELTASGGIDLRGGAVETDELSLELERVQVELLRPWIERDIPWSGEISGTAELDGPVSALATELALDVVPADTTVSRSAVVASGTLHLEDEIGFTSFALEADPIDYGLVRTFLSGIPLDGEGRLSVEAAGRLDGGLRVGVTALHRDGDLPESRLLADGTVRREGDEILVDVAGDLGPLSLTTLATYWPALPVSGELRGGFRAVGPLSELRVSSELETAGGLLALEGSVDARAPGDAYRLVGQLSAFNLSALVPAVPEPTELTGTFDIEGRGTTLDSAEARGRLELRAGRLGGLAIDTTVVALGLDRGSLRVDTVDAEIGGFDIDGGGRLAIGDGSPSGELRLDFVADSLGGLRSVLFGDSIVAREELNPFELTFAELEGIDPDTLPSLTEVYLGGRASGDVVLTGALRDFAADGTLRVEELAYAEHFVREASLTFSGAGLPDLSGRFQGELVADSLELFGRSFRGTRVDIDYTRPDGRVVVELERAEEEDYRARATFEADTTGARVLLEEMTLRLDTLQYSLADPVTVSWEASGITVGGFELVRSGPDPMRLAISGTLPREGNADFHVDLEGLDLSKLGRILQWEDQRLGGVLSLSADVGGVASAPTIEGRVEVQDVVYQGFDLSRVEGDLSYASRRASLDLEAWRDETSVFRAEGTVPVDLSLTGVENRILDEEMEVAVRAERLPATFAFGLVDALEEVTGTLDGDFTIAGTVDDPRPSGELVLDGAGFTMPVFGVSYSDVSGRLALDPDGTVQVDASLRAGGTLDVDGTVMMAPLSNPAFDLRLVFDDFRAVSRRDVEGRVSGEVSLIGRYQRPRIEGFEGEGQGLTVDQGTIYLDEFQRNATVVDLSDPRYVDFGDERFIQVDEEGRQVTNPFVDNLAVGVSLSVDNDTWLRSPDMNVEMRGDLTVSYDRGAREITLAGDLSALRGDYTVLQSRFEVEEGLIEFPGTPGINPNLAITARTRVRRPETEALIVTARVTGTLEDPRVQLSSADETIAQSDLVSYLLFGRPSYALTSSQAASVRSTTGSVLGSAGGVLGSAALGTLTSRLGALVAQNIGLDYFAISQPSNVFGSGSTSGTFAQTTLEGGIYLDDDLFLVAVVRPLGNLSGSASNILGGLRLEWSASQAYTVELFLEDRFLRSRAFGFQDVGATSSLVTGFFVFREWGY